MKKITNWIITGVLFVGLLLVMSQVEWVQEAWAQAKTVLYKDWQQTVTVAHIYNNVTPNAPPLTVTGNSLGIAATGFATDMLGKSTVGGLGALTGPDGQVRVLTDGGAQGALVLNQGSLWECLSAKERRIHVVTCPPYNAKGDGVTDDAVAVEMAMNSGPGTVYFPAGTYAMGKCLALKGNRQYIGAGVGATILKLKNNTQYGCMFGGPGPIENMEIAHMTIDGNRENHPGVGTGLVAFGGSGTTYAMNNLRFHDLKVQNATEYCMAMEGGTMTNIWMYNLWLDYCDRDGFDMKSPTDNNDSIFLSNIHVSHFGLADPLSAQAGIDVRGKFQMNNIRIDNVNGNHSGIRINRGLTEAEAALDPNGPVSGSQGTTLSNFQIYGTSDLALDNNEGLRVRSSDISVSNGFISGTNRGIFIDAGINVWGITFTGVSVTKTKNHGTYSNGAFDHGTGYINCNFNKNLGNGMMIVGDQTRLIGNNVMGNGLAGISIASSATSTQVVGNYVVGNGTNWVNVGAGTAVLGNLGIVAGNANIAVIAPGTTSVVVNHNMSAAPLLHWIALTLMENPTNDTGPMWATGATATQFTIHVKNDPGASGASIAWQARTMVQ